MLRLCVQIDDLLTRLEGSSGRSGFDAKAVAAAHAAVLECGRRVVAPAAAAKRVALHEALRCGCDALDEVIERCQDVTGSMSLGNGGPPRGRLDRHPRTDYVCWLRLREVRGLGPFFSWTHPPTELILA
jgi:hypothetical protein